MGLDLSAGVYPPFVWRVWRTFLPKGNVTPDLIRDRFDIIKVVRNIAPYMLHAPCFTATIKESSFRTFQFRILDPFDKLRTGLFRI